MNKFSKTEYRRQLDDKLYHRQELLALSVFATLFVSCLFN